MAAATVDYDPLIQLTGEGVVRYQTVASTTIFGGTLIVVVTASGLVAAATDASGRTFVGVSVGGHFDVAGVRYCNVRKNGMFLFFHASAAQTDVGLVALIKDDQTVDTTGTTASIVVGIIVGIEGTTKSRVLIDGRAN